MTTHQGPGPSRRIGPSAESTLLTLAILALVVVLLSAVQFTVAPRNASSSSTGGSTALPRVGSSGGDGELDDTSGFTATDIEAFSADLQEGETLAVDDTGNLVAVDQSGKVVRQVAAAGTGSGSTGSTKSGGSTALGGGSGTGGTGSGGTGSGTGGGGTGGGGGGTGGGGGGTGGGGFTGNAECTGAKNGGATSDGVTATEIKIGAATVESGPGATFLQPQSVAMKAVASRINSQGGICGRKIKLQLHDTEWKAQVGASAIQNMILADKVFAIAVNPDSEGLNAVSAAPYGNGDLDEWKVPVIGTDGLLFSQYKDPYIWPIAASTSTAMHAMAKSQSQLNAASTKFSIVYEQTYRFGREGANAYNHMVNDITGANIVGYRDPTKDPQCKQAFCGIQEGSQAYGTQANEINGYCGNGNCQVGAVLLEPATAIKWFNSGGRFGGIENPSGGKGAAPQPLFQRYFADGCQQKCNGMRLWTGFKPPIAPFDADPAVQQYVSTMRAYAGDNVDRNNQFAEGAYVGMLLLEKVLKDASVGQGGLTRSKVIAALNATSNWQNGLTVAPLTWTPDNHFALQRVHAFDEQYSSSLGGWQFVRGSETEDPLKAQI